MAALDLQDRVAIVTGGAGGMGSVTARHLAAAGAKVVVADLPSAPIDDVVDALKASGHDVVGQAVDLTDESSIAELVGAARAAFGRIDILDNNAAATHLTHQDGAVADQTVERFDAAMAVNVRAPMLLVKHALPALVASGNGAVVNISSGQGLLGDDMSLVYGASKAALNQLTRHLATQLGPQGIRVNAIACGLIRTPMMEASVPPPLLELFEANCLVPRLGTPEDVAEMVTFLASDRASYVTGQVISVDGGFLAHTPTVAPVRRLMAEMMGGPAA